jgi:ABC-type uncharacterized transport system substrate-binding protein
MALATNVRLLFAITGLSAAAMVAVQPTPASAHPHMWIDIAVEVVFDGGKRVTGLRETWLLDEFYTAYATQGLDADGDGQPDPDKLAALLTGQIKHLADVSYFTKVTQGKQATALGKVEEATSRMVGHRLEMTFLLPFQAPVDLAAGPLVYAIYDPTYYIEVLHAERPDAVRLVNAPKDCRSRLIPPHPTPENVMLAQALDTTQTAGDGLGLLFAEKVSVRCAS